ncbi:mucin-5B-like [Ascaphus truei]|uniref:mucin-5B-like n=1 Tax=Ascaphus truei TaxID=8439 RepID=UPI003F594FB3
MVAYDVIFCIKSDTESDENICTNGQWDCADFDCPGTCSVEGGSHIRTYDNQLYRFNGECSYVLSKVCRQSLFTVHGELRSCNQNDGETCLVEIVLVLHNTQTTQVLSIKPNGEVNDNSQIAELPYHTSNFTVFQPTTFYIIVQTTIGLQLTVQLVPIMQVYIHLDTSYMGRTCGLCGNYNNIQKDDYRTGNGMIARLPTTFANTWQSRKNCKPVPNLFIDPCTHSIQNEPFASFFCSKLQDQTEIFSACHSKVDVLNFYENCLFDACVCKNQQDCMCAALSSYVRACNEKGIHLDGWRTNLCDSYKNACPESMEYQYLIETCQPTCKSLSVPDPSCIVNFTAIDGCVCKAGTYMKNPDECVEIDACPCYNMGSPVNPGDKVNKNEVTCTCIKGRLICEAREKYRIDCKPPMTYFNCSVEPEGSIGVECLRSCQTLNVDCYSIECISGCVCPGDLLADGTGSCVPSNKCTCIYNDKIYQHLETATIGCSLCTCKNRKWDCEKGEMLGVCTVYGEGNYITFDSRQYRYSGQCEYTLVQVLCELSTYLQDHLSISKSITYCNIFAKQYFGNETPFRAGRHFTDHANH